MTDKNIAKKEKAIELMKRLSIYKPYIKGLCQDEGLSKRNTDALSMP